MARPQRRHGWVVCLGHVFIGQCVMDITGFSLHRSTVVEVQDGVGGEELIPRH